MFWYQYLHFLLPENLDNDKITTDNGVDGTLALQA
jgi:hypothetical protein